jgi:hypothetical protein
MEKIASTANVSEREKQIHRIVSMDAMRVAEAQGGVASKSYFIVKHWIRILPGLMRSFVAPPRPLPWQLSTSVIGYHFGSHNQYVSRCHRYEKLLPRVLVLQANIIEPQPSKRHNDASRTLIQDLAIYKAKEAREFPS